MVRIAVLERSVPARAAVIAGRVDEEDRGVALGEGRFGGGLGGLGGRDQLVGGFLRGHLGAGGFAAVGGGAPGRGVILHAGARDPHFGLVIGDRKSVV